MDSKARIISIGKDWKTGKYQIAFETDSAPENITGDVRLNYKKWREKRSLDANGYLWVLIEQIAIVTDSSKDEVYEEFIQKDGLLDMDENGFITITMRADIDPAHLPGHWRLYQTTDEWNVFRRIRGTSEYDTKEMSWFLDRVIEEAKALGIETATPEELERIKSYEKKRIG